jgi:hypothetical protein
MRVSGGCWRRGQSVREGGVARHEVGGGGPERGARAGL